MSRHSVIAYRDDRHPDVQPIDFSGDVWLRYIRLRDRPILSLFQERLPSGAAAVLINQTHTDRDLFLPISAAEKRLLDGVDGLRTIREIEELTQATSSDTSQFELGGKFFERLWWQDQAVFDASRTD